MFIWGIGGRMKVGRREREEIDEIPLFGRGQKGREGEAKPSRPTKIDPPKIGLIWEAINGLLRQMCEMSSLFSL